MAQVMQWPPAIRKEGKVEISTCPPHPIPLYFKQRKKPTCQGSDCIYRLGTRVTVYACVLKFFFVFKLAVSN